MPNPTMNDLHLSSALRDMSVGHQQADTNFVLAQSGPFQPVDKVTDYYHVYDEGDWNRMEMQPRADSAESEGSGWRLSSSSYDCTRWAVHKDFDWRQRGSTDEVIDMDSDAAEWTANQARIYGDYLLGTNVFAESVWTTDLDGTTSTVTPGTNVKKWSESSGDPLADFAYYGEVMRGLMGEEPNVMVVGAKTHARLLVNAAVRSAYQYSTPTELNTMRAKMAAYFGVEKYLVGGAYRNTAAEGATKTLSFILDDDSVWFGYVNPEIGKRKMTAFRCFAYKDEGRANNGVVTRKFDMVEKTSTRYEIECYWDVQVINADAGVFIADVVD